MAVMAMKSGEPQPQSLLEKTNQLLFFGKGTFVYLEFDTQATEPDKGLKIYENSFRFMVPMNYVPIAVNIIAIGETGNIIDGAPIAKLTYDTSLMSDNCLVIAEPPEGYTVDTSKHWIAYVICVGIDVTKVVVGLESATGTVEEKMGVFIVKYADTNGTDTVTIHYDDGSTETITVDKSNLWTVNPFEPGTGGGEK